MTGVKVCLLWLIISQQVVAIKCVNEAQANQAAGDQRNDHSVLLTLPNPDIFRVVHWLPS